MLTMQNTRNLIPVALLVAACLGVASARADDAAGYMTPPTPLADIVDAPQTPQVRLSPDRQWMLLLERPTLLSLADLSEPELRLAGLRMRPRTNGPSRSTPVHKLTLKNFEDLSERVVSGLPDRPSIRNVAWSPNGAHFSFTVTLDTDIQLWVGDVATASARRLGSYRLNAVTGSPAAWLNDTTLICRTVPAERGAAPVAPRVPAAPIMKENLGQKAPARTYQDLLSNTHDEALFEYYLQSRLVKIDLEGNAVELGPAEMVVGMAPSPDGSYLHVETLQRPFSYLVPYYRFPRNIEIRDTNGELVHRVASNPLQEGVPTQFGSAPIGPRSAGWRSDAPATFTWAEAQDGGDPRKEAEIRDKVFQLAAPFDGEPEVLASLALRFGGTEWGSGEMALVNEWWWKSRQVRTWRVRPADTGKAPELVWDRSWEDRYADPGEPVYVINEYGRNVMFTGGKKDTLFLAGDGASDEGDRPFLDRFNLKSGKMERLWRSEAPYYERSLLPMDEKGRTFLTMRESREEPANFFVRDMKNGKLRQLTEFPHPTPQLLGLQKELIRYDREDGVKMTATLYLPPGYSKEQGPLPLVVWAYPQEFKSADAAGQVTDSPYRFDRIGWWSPLLFLSLGYAVLDDPTMPIIGEGEEEPNDTYVEQLVSSAKAAIDEVARRGVGDPDRVAIGGHSYGAFMTANLLAHSDLFRAGIARSGAYNRTLTPFGFQAEERTVWEAPDVYFKMSPFMHAEKVDEPILLIHGDADNNSGTYPMQSERFYNALKGLGATARLVMLPHESHGYRARESVMHMLWEQATWLDRYVKSPDEVAAGH
jgi:dipeptidyl aminopeptidase/acylaminoacyl peptidase